MRHSVAAPTPPRAFGVNFLGFARQASNAGTIAVKLNAGRTAVTAARLSRISWPLVSTARMAYVKVDLTDALAVFHQRTRGPRVARARPRMVERLHFLEHGPSR